MYSISGKCWIVNVVIDCINLMTDLPDDTPLQNTATASQTTPSFAPVVIRIDYELENPRNGLIFVDPDEVVAPYVSRNHFFVIHLDQSSYMYLALPPLIYHQSTAAWSNACLVAMHGPDS